MTETSMVADGADAVPWMSRAASSATAESLVAVAGVDPAKLSGADLVDAIVTSEKALSLLAAVQMRLMAALAVPFVAGDPMRLAARIARKNAMIKEDSAERTEMCVPEAATCLAAAEIGAALRISPVTAGIRVREAANMTTALAPTLHALEQGLLDRGKARVISQYCQPLSTQHTADLQNVVLPEADRLTTSELRELTGQAVIAIDPDGAEERHHAAAARRELTLRANEDAMATLSAFLPADGAVKIFQISDLLATSTAAAPDDTRGIGARRVDALVDIADHLLTHGHLDLSYYLGNALPDSTRDPRTDRTRPAETTDEAGLSDSAGSQAQDQTADPVAASGNSDPTAHPTEPCDPADTEGAEQPAHSAHPDETDRIFDPADPVGADFTIRNAEPAGSFNTAEPSDPAVTEPVTSPTEPVEPAIIGDLAQHSCPATTDRVADLPDHLDDIQGSVSTAPEQPATDTSSRARSRRAMTRQGRRPHLSVTIGLGTLAGLDQLPALLAGFGAIPACLGRTIANSAGTVTALFADPKTGVVTDAGDLTYRPTQQLRDRIAAMNPTCQFPSCRQPVWRCDIDHREPFDHDDPANGGPTDSDNTGPFCRRHHLLKHHADWRFRPNPKNFTLDWTSPTGHNYVSTTRPALLAHLNVTTAGTAIAERLDLLAMMNSGSHEPPSLAEELLTTMLLHRNEAPLEYQPDANCWNFDETENGNAGADASRSEDDEDVDDNDDDAPTELPEEPPF